MHTKYFIYQTARIFNCASS